MADIAHTLVFEALTRAATAPEGLPLYAAKANPGLFAATAAGKSAAERCKEEGLLRVLRCETKGRTSQEVCGLTDKGLSFLLHHANPRPVLEAFVGAVRDRQGTLDAILESVRQSQQALDALQDGAAKVLERLAQDPPTAAGIPAEDEIAQAIRDQLKSWHEAGLLGDCPLPELCQRVRAACPRLTIGQFHDRLRLLHEAQ